MPTRASIYKFCTTEANWPYFFFFGFGFTAALVYVY